MVLRQHAARLPAAGSSASFVRRKEIIEPTRQTANEVPIALRLHTITTVYLPLAPFECGGVSLCWCVWEPSAYRVLATCVVAKIYRPGIFLYPTAQPPPTKETIV